ncbi:MAG: hypothetical protein KGL39_18120 [Patescibacteria group bacterium]|nr:hypothetical protein [Patescibacteria group bacterium]
MSKLSRRVIEHEDTNWFAKHNDSEQDEMATTLAHEVEAAESRALAAEKDRDAALSRLEVEQARADELSRRMLDSERVHLARFADVVDERDALREVVDAARAVVDSTAESGGPTWLREQCALAGAIGVLDARGSAESKTPGGSDSAMPNPGEAASAIGLQPSEPAGGSLTPEQRAPWWRQVVGRYETLRDGTVRQLPTDSALTPEQRAEVEQVDDYTQRLRVPGGWLYRWEQPRYQDSPGGVAMVFVPEAK